MIQTGANKLRAEIKRLEARLDVLENKPKTTKTRGVPSSTAQVNGAVVATFNGRVTPTTSLTTTAVTWTKVKSDDPDIGYEGSRIQLGQGQHLLAWELKGIWPGGFHRFDEVDAVAVHVIDDPDDDSVGGNMVGLPLHARGYVTKVAGTPPSRGAVHAYGNSISLGISSVYVHHADLGGQAFATPTRIEITLTVQQLIEG